MMKFIYSILLFGFSNIIGLGQKCDFFILNVTGGAIKHLELCNEDSVLNVYNEQGQLVKFGIQNFNYIGESTFTGKPSYLANLVKFNDLVLTDELGTLKVRNKNGKVIFIKKRIKEEIYSIDFNDTFIVLNLKNQIRAINYRNNKSSIYYISNKDSWFVKIRGNDILYFDSTKNFISLNIYSSTRQKIIGTNSSEGFGYQNINEKSFCLFNNSFTYIIENNIVKISTQNIDSNLIKLVVVNGREYFYNTLNKTMLINDINNTQNQQVLEIQNIQYLNNGRVESGVPESLVKLNNWVPYAIEQKWVISEAGDILINYSINGRALIFKIY